MLELESNCFSLNDYTETIPKIDIIVILTYLITYMITCKESQRLFSRLGLGWMWLKGLVCISSTVILHNSGSLAS